MATRFSFPFATVADVSPAYHAEWFYSTDALRRRMVVTKGASAIQEGTQIGPWEEFAVGQALDRQYVSDPLEGVQVIGAGTWKMQLMTRQVGDVDVEMILTALRVVTNDGSAVRGELATGLQGRGTIGQLINNASHRNTTCVTAGAGLSTVIAEHGDRIVLEVGYANGWAFIDNPIAAAKWGEDAPDLPEDDTQTSDGAGWMELSDNLVFQSDPPPPPPPTSSYVIRRRSGGINVDTTVTLGTSDALVRSLIWVPADRAEVQAMEMGMARGAATPGPNVQMEDAWLMVEYLPIAVPGGGPIVDLKQFRRRFGAGR